MPYQKREGFPDHFPVGMTYVPWQTWNQIYDFDKALQQGTLFPELDKPFIGRRACP
ncbi:MAG: spore coat associated protein CotJA [Lachnospiraceae bacterium]|nr:spore coat associated protein CotJA [Lachnospiraceae bacterium]